MSIELKWHQPDERTEGREDSSWYTYESNHDAVVTVTKGDDSITVYADGEMRVLIYREGDPHKGYDTVRYCDQWAEHAITNDADIVEANEKGSIEWVNNSWYDLYCDDHEIGDDGWLNCVCHSLSDAIEQATTLLNEGLDKFR